MVDNLETFLLHVYDDDRHFTIVTPYSVVSRSMGCREAADKVLDTAIESFGLSIDALKHGDFEVFRFSVDGCVALLKSKSPPSFTGDWNAEAISFFVSLNDAVIEKVGYNQ